MKKVMKINICDYLKLTNGKIMHRLETFVGELKQETRFAHTGVANDDILEEIGVRHAACYGLAIKQIHTILHNGGLTPTI